MATNIIDYRGWFRRNLSLTGLYYHFSNYGESIVRPTIIGAITVGLSTLFWLMQSNPTLSQRSLQMRIFHILILQA